MYRLTLFFCLFFLIVPVIAVSAAEKPLKSEEVLTLRNYELSLQNLQLQIEVFHREIERLNQEREMYFDKLYRNYGLDKKWKIDLEKGIWIIEEVPKAENTQGEKTIE